MHELDDVKRALVRGHATAVAKRTGMPVAVVMSLASVNDWDVAKAEALINEVMRDAVRDMSNRINSEILYGGGPGGGKQEKLYGQSPIARFDVLVGVNGILNAPRGVVTCVS